MYLFILSMIHNIIKSSEFIGVSVSQEGLRKQWPVNMVNGRVYKLNKVKTQKRKKTHEQDPEMLPTSLRWFKMDWSEVENCPVVSHWTNRFGNKVVTRILDVLLITQSSKSESNVNRNRMKWVEIVTQKFKSLNMEHKKCILLIIKVCGWCVLPNMQLHILI